MKLCSIIHASRSITISGANDLAGLVAAFVVLISNLASISRRNSQIQRWNQTRKEHKAEPNAKEKIAIHQRGSLSSSTFRILSTLNRTIGIPSISFKLQFLCEMENRRRGYRRKWKSYTKFLGWKNTKGLLTRRNTEKFRQSQLILDLVCQRLLFPPMTTRQYEWIPLYFA